MFLLSLNSLAFAEPDFHDLFISQRIFSNELVEDNPDGSGSTQVLKTAFIADFSKNFKLDGIVDDTSWMNLTPIQLVMHIPTFGIQPSENSEVFFCHDNEYVYVAGRFYDKEPDKIGISTRMRDDIGPTEDAFVIIFDTFNDHENAVGFWTNAGGVKNDFTITRDGTEGSPWPFNLTWNTFWDAKSTRDEKGWYTEIRIPLSSLRFKEINGTVEMGFICYRFIPRKFELNVFPNIPRNWGFWSFVKPSQAQKIQLSQVQSKKPFYVTPYVAGGVIQESHMNGANTDYKLKNDPRLAAGLDVKYGITSNLTADLTLNTDFAQVESDNAQINLTRFSLFFPEKRLFFQERTSNFAFAFDDMNTLFYSRQIGLHNGELVPIIGGIRLVGREGRWDIGFLDMQTRKFKTNETDGTYLPTENFGVLRLRRQTFNSNSYIGGIATSRIGKDGTYNAAIGIDGMINVLGDDYLDIKLAQTFDDKYRNKVLSPKASRIWLNWERRSEKGIGYNLFYSQAGNKYEPDLGFEFRRNYYLLGADLKYNWIPGEKSKIRNHIVWLKGKLWKELGTNVTQSTVTGLTYDLSLKTGYDLTVNLLHNFEQLNDTFFLSNDAVKAYVEPGRYNYNYASFHINSPYPQTKVISADVSIGQFYDGNQFTFSLLSILKFGALLRLEPSYTYNRINFAKRNQTFIGQIAGLSTLIMLSNKLSVSYRFEYSNISHGIVSNFRLRYNHKEGNDLYLVFNEGRNIELYRESPALSPIENRVILIKYTYTFLL
jgi:hypothetical protein